MALLQDLIRQINDPTLRDRILQETDKLMKQNPTSIIRTSGLDVGLPEGQMGNSEVGHTNIGAGRKIWESI